MESVIRWIAWGLVMLAGLAFLFAVLTVFVDLGFLDFDPETYSRASSNMALLAIALWFVGVKKGSKKD